MSTENEIITKTALKRLFENGDVPSQQEFWGWMDSYWHKEDEIPVEAFNIDVSSKADKNAENLSNQDKTDWKSALGISATETQIKITANSHISITTLDPSGLSQNGKNVLIDNSTNNINVVCDAAGDQNFIATYIKLGSGTISFTTAAGVTKTAVDGISVLNGGIGSRAMVCRNNNNFLIYIYNV